MLLFQMKSLWLTLVLRALTMPDITDDTVGKVFVIKDAKGTGASANNITLQDSAAGHQIDGQINHFRVWTGCDLSCCL